MVTHLTTYDQIAIAQVAIYAVFLVGGIILIIKHGFGRSAGYRFIIILALARLIGNGMYVATIEDPKNIKLYIGWAATNGIGLGPLILAVVGLLSRAIESINRRGDVVLKPLYQRGINLLVLIATVFLTVGGIESNYTIEDGRAHIEYDKWSKIGMGLAILAVVLVLLEIILVFVNKRYIIQGENRILPAVALAWPFLVVRCAYSSYQIFGEKSTNVWEYLGADVIMEIIVVLICEVEGFALSKKNSEVKAEYAYQEGRAPANYKGGYAPPVNQQQYSGSY